jgi:hypothetical protein
MRTPILVFLYLASAAAAAALTTEEVIELSRAGVTDEVLIAQIEADGSRFALSTADLERLRGALVSEAVIGAMQAAAGRDGEEPAAAAPDPTRAPAETGEGPERPEPGEALVAVRNEDRSPVALVIDRAARTVEFSAAPGTTVVPPGRERRFSLPPGAYVTRWRAEPKSYRVSIRAGDRTDLVLLAIDAPDAVGVRLRVLRNGRDFGSTTLRLAPRPSPQDAAADRPPRGAVLGPRPPIVVRETVFVPAPVTFVEAAPYHHPCGPYAPVATYGRPPSYVYGTHSTSFHMIRHTPSAYVGPIYYEVECGR